MGPEELNRFALRHTSEISRTTVALLKHVSGEADHFGSGVLLQVEGTRFLVTAAHVTDEFFCEQWKQIFFGTPSEDDLLPVTTVRYCRSKKRTDPNREDDPEYILRLIGQVICVSLETVKIVKALPALGISTSNSPVGEEG